MNRRDFLQRTAVYSVGLSAIGSQIGCDSKEKSQSTLLSPYVPGTPDIKVACASWAFHGFKAGESNPLAAIDVLGEMGFDGIECIVNHPDDLIQLWTDELIGQVRMQLDKYKMEVTQLALFQPVVEDLSSLDEGKRAKALDHFESGVVIAKKLGANLINIVAPWPRELSRPDGGYLPRYYDLPDAKPGDKFILNMDDSFDWELIWAQYVKTTQECLSRATKHGLRFTIENHTHCMVPDTSSFLLLWNEINDPGLGINLDVGWILEEREYPPVAINKVKRHLYNLHIRDIDGYMSKFVHIGHGVMDFKGIIDQLKKIGYRGYVVLEQDKHPGNMKETVANYLKLMRELING